MTGWIKLHRTSLNHWLYTEYRPLTRREAWETILLTVNFEPAKSLIRGQIYDCLPGQSLLSLESWAKKFVWSIQQVRTFFKILELDGMISIEGLQYTTRLTVCNWATYQSDVTDQQQTNNMPLTDQQHAANMPLTTIKESKELKNNKNDKNIYSDFLAKFNSLLDRKFKVIDKKTTGQINARLKEGFTLEDILTAAVNCSKDKYHIENPQYLTPEFITRPDKLQKYLNANKNGTNKSDYDEIPFDNSRFTHH